MFEALKFREYRIFWIGNSTSNIGIFMLMAANLWLMHELTNTVLYLGILTFTGLGPILVLSMWGGVIADRVNRVRLVTHYGIEESDITKTLEIVDSAISN